MERSIENTYSRCWRIRYKRNSESNTRNFRCLELSSCYENCLGEDMRKKFHLEHIASFQGNFEVNAYSINLFLEFF